MNKLVDKVPDGYALISIDALKAWGKYDEVRNACQFSAEQAEQEPVAWMAKNGEVCRHGWRKFHAREEDVDRFRTPLYAAPVRTKDLTAEEISDVFDSVGTWKETLFGDLPVVFARAVIAADREKNK